MRYVALLWKGSDRSNTAKAVVTANDKAEAKGKILGFIEQYRISRPQEYVIEPGSIQMEVLTMEEFIRTQPKGMRPRLRMQLKDMVEEISDDVYIPHLDPILQERRWHSKYVV